MSRCNWLSHGEHMASLHCLFEVTLVIQDRFMSTTVDMNRGVTSAHKGLINASETPSDNSEGFETDTLLAFFCFINVAVCAVHLTLPSVLGHQISCVRERVRHGGNGEHVFLVAGRRMLCVNRKSRYEGRPAGHISPH